MSQCTDTKPKLENKSPMRPFILYKWTRSTLHIHVRLDWQQQAPINLRVSHKIQTSQLTLDTTVDKETYANYK